MKHSIFFSSKLEMFTLPVKVSKKYRMASSFVSCLILLLLIGAVHSQTTLEPCETADLTFDAPPETTLCSQYEGITYDISIGLNTPYPRSSSLPLLPPNPKIRVVNHFIIDTDLQLQGATIQVAQGVFLIMSDGTIPPTTGIGKLTLDDCDIFACTGLWEGIVMSKWNSVKTLNSTRIEDAKGAIQARWTQNCTLDISNTIFNRNDKGIWLENNPNDTNKPTFSKFSENTFTCTAPLNGTSNGVSYAGLHLIDVSLLISPSQVNIFRELQHGIYAEGISCNIATSKLYMQRIKANGIYLQEGNLTLTNCDFYDNRARSIYIETAKVVNINTTDFLLTPALPTNSNPDHYFMGVKIDKFALNAKIDIKQNSFKADMLFLPLNRVKWILLTGGNVGAGTKIEIKVNIFYFVANQSTGVELSGIFPITSITEIWVNQFRISPATDSGAEPTGIKAYGGDKNNLSIKWNTFTGYNASYSPLAGGITLVNSAGDNNEVSNNAFNDDIQSCHYYAYIDGFQKTTFCSNTFDSYGGQISFKGANPSTKLISNTIAGVELHLYGANSSIGVQVGAQETFGNKWFDIKLPNGFVFGAPNHAICEGDPSLSKFSVHTPQSTCMNFDTGPTCYFSPFYPTRITPNDPIDGLFDIVNLPPSEGCNSSLAPTTDELDRRVAQGLFNPVNDPAMEWEMERYFYKKLSDSPSLINEHPSFPLFMTSKENSSVGKFYLINKSIQAALIAEPSINSNSSFALDNINLLTDALLVCLFRPNLTTRFAPNLTTLSCLSKRV
jgi:hypothetical protein